MSLKRKLTTTQCNLASSSDAFVNLDVTVPDDLHNIWKDQETKALAERLSNPNAMDIFEVQLEKGEGFIKYIWKQIDIAETAPSIKSVEMDLIEMQATRAVPWGCATWLARTLKVEESQIILPLDVWKINKGATESQRLNISCCHDRLQSQINGLVQTTATYIEANWDCGYDSYEYVDPDNSEDDPFITPSTGHAEHMLLPLPSYIGLPRCSQLGLSGLVDHELQLRQGQANDTLHEI